MKSLVLATKNNGKIKELTNLLAPYSIQTISATDALLPDVEETGQTFAENAILKAVSAANFTDKPALADDSGLCVDALHGAPGVYTARYGGYETLLSKMSENENRNAHFMCVLALALPNGTTHTFDGRVDGTISTQPKGDKGFGYDPVFIPKNSQSTYAEMTSEEKAKTSHRNLALQKFLSFIDQNPLP